MAVIHCKACGRSYRYESEGCCPSCGAYNRPPKHERVNADGTVQHMTDAAYEKRKKAHEKVCFEEKVCYEEKTCYEDQARRGVRKGSDRQERAATSAAFSNRLASVPSPRKNRRKGNPAVGLIVAAIAMLISFATTNGIFSRKEEHNVVPEPANVVPADVTWADAKMGETLEMMDGSTIAVTSWGGSNDDQINVYLKMDLQDGDHEFYAALICLDQEGRETYLTDFSVEETDRGTCLQFSADGEELEPAYLELEERLEDATLQTLYVDLQS